MRDVDVVFDTVSGGTLQRSWGVLKENGRMVTIAEQSGATPDERIKRAFFIVEPNSRQLDGIGKLLDAGKLRPVVDTVLPWPQASEAYTGKVKKKGRGKVVVIVSAPRFTRAAYDTP